MKYFLILLAVVALATLSWLAFRTPAEPQKPPAAVAPSEPPPKAKLPPKPARPLVKAAEDRSLTPEGYAAAGLPDLQKPWTPDDYKEALRVLSQISKQDPRKLPRYASDRSGIVFERIAASENIASITDKTIPLTARAALFSGYGPMVAIAELYADASETAIGSFDRELVELYVLVLRLHLAESRFAEDFMQTIGADDPTRPRRLEARSKMRESGAQWIRESLAAFRSGAFGKSAVLRFADQLSGPLPEFLPFLSGTSRADIIDKINKLAQTEPDQDVKRALAVLAEASAAAKTPAPK